MTDFYLGKTRDHKAAKRFFKKALRSFHISNSYVITLDKYLAYLCAESKKEKKIPAGITKRQVKYLNHNVEQNYRCIRKLFKVFILFSE
ncbi:DDE-type integrase/transposase/recombinase [Bacillus pseudomycoides]|uniref:DDE-type integrase/transposase/recombinase n=1 Tax=Bacillus TaxID=1386 RepID=UPI0035C920B7